MGCREPIRGSVSARGQLARSRELFESLRLLSDGGMHCGTTEETPSESGRGETVDAADFNWSARGETRGAEPLKVGES